MNPSRMDRRQAGMTLIELMIAVLIVGILAGIAIPSYRSHVIRVKRADAKVALISTAQTLERCFTRFNAYDNAACNTGLPFNTPDDTYTISGVIAANTFTLTATPQGGQAKDTDCANFVLNQAGTQTVSGSKPATECW